MDTTPKQPVKKAVAPTPEELQVFNKDLDELLKKHSFVLQPTLKVTPTGITPEFRVFKIIDVSPLKVPTDIKPEPQKQTPDAPKIDEKPKEPIPPTPQSEVDEKAVN